ncbi:hypothetical protein CCH79_00017257 [Gambusia affinis]|uniref:B30.2/SPRY domain-containing protein n=1 Tax=Gambusia affinis TaxID=33528 RepID=A0A315WCN1_GAMAF|nr:hypothetical protein CCH79_00017257 [Gambusia affinis]
MEQVGGQRSGSSLYFRSFERTESGEIKVLDVFLLIGSPCDSAELTVSSQNVESMKSCYESTQLVQNQTFSEEHVNLVSGNQNLILLRILSFNLNPAVCHFGATNQNQHLFNLKEGSVHLNRISASSFSPEWTSRARRLPEVRLHSSIKHIWTPYLRSVHQFCSVNFLLLFLDQIQDLQSLQHGPDVLIQSDLSSSGIPFQELERNMICFIKNELKKIQKIAVDKALRSPNGHLDLFLRFLLGLSLQANQRLLHGLQTQKARSLQKNQETIQYIKQKISDNVSIDKSINLFYCLNELKDCSLQEEIRKYLKSGSLSTDKLSSTQWSALVFILLSSGKDLDEFDLKKYSASEEALLRLLPVVKAAKKAVLSGCNLSARSCEALSSVLGSQSSSLRELDLSNNDLEDSGIKQLCQGLESPCCKLETLSLSGCLISEKGCSSLASALISNPSHLRELDLSYNHPGESGLQLLSASQKIPDCRLDTIRLGLIILLTLDPNTAHKFLKLSENNRKVTDLRKEHPYPDHPARFDYWPQVLCETGLTGRCYWEVEWVGKVYVAVSYRGIGRNGDSDGSKFGGNDQSWCLACTDGGFSAWHNNSGSPIPLPSSPTVSHRVGVYVDRPAGILSFYRVSGDVVTHLHTFSTTFTEPLYAGFGYGVKLNSSALLCQLCEWEQEAERERERERKRERERQRGRERKREREEERERETERKREEERENSLSFLFTVFESKRGFSRSDSVLTLIHVHYVSLLHLQSKQRHGEPEPLKSGQDILRETFGIILPQSSSFGSEFSQRSTAEPESVLVGFYQEEEEEDKGEEEEEEGKEEDEEDEEEDNCENEGEEEKEEGLKSSSTRPEGLEFRAEARETLPSSSIRQPDSLQTQNNMLGIQKASYDATEAASTRGSKINLHPIRAQTDRRAGI